MCEYTQVEYRCGHCRFIVRAWCETYERTHRRCKPDIRAAEFRFTERCGDCKTPTQSPKWLVKMNNNNGGSHASSRGIRA